MISVEEALGILADETGALEIEEVALAEAQNRAIAETVTADRDFPPTDRAAMDGFAVATADLDAPGGVLEVIGEARAGEDPRALRAGDGKACRIFTGAVVPPGADAVVMVERTEEDPETDTVRIAIRPVAGQHIRPRGQDLRRGETVLEPGSAIRPAGIAALASVGRTRVRVHRRPVVRLLSTGDEIVEPDRTPLEHQVRNSNSPTLLAQLRELDLTGDYLGIAPDERAALARRLREGLVGDVLLITGGVSVGKYDLVGEALAAAGMRRLFHKVAVKPGKPILAGRCGPCLVLGLPGNPVSALTGFALFAAPVLRRMLGYRSWENVGVTARLEQPLRCKPGRATYHLARAEANGGRLTVRGVPSTGSGDMLSMVRANAFIVSAVDARDCPAGAEVPVLLWRDFDLR